MQYFLLVFMAIIAGALLPFQAGLNAQLGKSVSSDVYGAMLSLVIGALGMVIYAIASGVPFAKISDAKGLSWWVWTGGLMGAFYVLSIIVVAPRLGVALTFGITVAAQMLFSLATDHYGWFDLPVDTISWAKVLGVLLIIGGVVLIRAV